MSRNTATIISLPLLILTLTLSCAYAGCPGYDSVADILTHYDLPPGIFPNNVEDFSCVSLSDKDKTIILKLTIRLQDDCKVSRKISVDYNDDDLDNIVKYKQEISAIISLRQLTHINGVTFMLTPPFKPIDGELLKLTDIYVFDYSIFGILEYFRFYCNDYFTPPIPLSLFDKPATCDSDGAAFEYPGSAGVVATSKHDLRSLDYKSGRLLPLVIA